MKKDNHISRPALIESIVLLREVLYVEKLPVNTLTTALRENRWFSSFYISSSFSGIRSWLHSDVLQKFLASYPASISRSKKVAVIAAGNLPLVCFHDVLMTLFAGHICMLKCSHQDRVLIKYIRKKWIEILPEVANRFIIVEQIPEVDFLISTGSNNTARYIEANFPTTPKLVRRNRYTVGLLKPDMSEKEMLGLAKDILLYNGLGCRNVSNLLIYPNVDERVFYEILKDYPQNYLNPMYLERVLYERVRLEQLGRNFKVFPNILVKPSSQFSFASMGLIFGVYLKQEKFQKEEGKELLARHHGDIQTVVGLETDYGNAQSPSLKDFADNVDTLKLLSTLSNHSA